MSDDAPTVTLTGILATSDAFGRLRLCLVDALPSRTVADTSWARLKAAVPDGGVYDVPYSFPLGGAPDDAGIRGECWAAVPGGRGRAARARRARMLALAAELRGKEVVLTVRPKRYSFASRAPHNSGAEVAGTSLQVCTLERAAHNHI
jgi:hypothetical protein